MAWAPRGAARTAIMEGVVMRVVKDPQYPRSPFFVVAVVLMQEEELS